MVVVPLDEVTPPPLCRAGDRVAIVSPSMALPSVFPHVHELGLQRLRDVYGLEPVEYPTTRRLGARAEDRAADLMDAFTDPTIRAVLATIGGEDQITVLRHLNAEVLRTHPKRFFGYSDNTNLLNYLVRLGMTTLHGGSTMVHLGRAGRLHPMTEASLRAALFTGGQFELKAADRYADHGNDWSDPANLIVEPWSRPAPPWSWAGRAERVHGRLWGGSLEILDWTLQVGRYVSDPEHYRGAILFIETSEEIPPSTYVYRTLRCMGERGLLEVLGGMIVARPAAQSLGASLHDNEAAAYADDQRAAVQRAVDAYHPGLPTVFGVEAGHTDPQVILPIGGHVLLDAIEHRVVVEY